MQRDHTCVRSVASLRVIGIGGCGINTLNGLVKSGVQGIDFVALSSDVRTLSRANVSNCLCIGQSITKGKGAGGDPAVGEQVALASQLQIKELLAGADMVFIAAGMGGGTGTGAAPLVAAMARSMGILTIAAVTTPFQFEGPYRFRRAEVGIEKLRQHVDTLLVIPNERVFEMLAGQISLRDAFGMVDEVLLQAILGVTELITTAGFINLDFATVRTVMSAGGMAIISMGKATGPDRAQLAAKQATCSPMHNATIDGARALLINITAGPDLTLHEVEQAVRIIENMVHADANVIFGTVIDECAGDELRITVIATGCERHYPYMPVTLFPRSRYVQESSSELSMPRFSLKDYKIPVFVG
jgi:cell division protein FtsZ